jgi:hypothetical protein
LAWCWITTITDNGIWQDTITVFIEDDLALLWQRIIWPEPNKILTDGKVATFNVAYAKHAGNAETAIKQLISNQIGAGAQNGRRDNRLFIPPSNNQGRQISIESRFAVLGEIVAQHSEDAGYRATICHDEAGNKPQLTFMFTPVNDRSDSVRFGDIYSPSTGFITAWNYSLERPETTYVVVAAQGEKEDRQIIAIGPDTDAEQLWGMRREMLLDQRQADANQTESAAEAVRNGRTRLEENAAPVSITFTVADTADCRYRQHYQIGDLVSVDLPGLPTQVAPIREATTKITETGTEVSVVIGSPGVTEHSTRQARAIATALGRIRNLETT